MGKKKKISDKEFIIAHGISLERYNEQYEDYLKIYGHHYAKKYTNAYFLDYLKYVNDRNKELTDEN